jgi:hypothetical protein
MTRLASLRGFVLAAAVSGMLIGCGKSSTVERQEITGTVKFRGRPVDDGYIRFAPLDGQPSGDSAQIVKGKYTIVRAKGMYPGKYRVSIWAGNEMSGAGDASPDSPHAGKPQARERIPAKYNNESELVREVTQDGPNEFNFEIP